MSLPSTPSQRFHTYCNLIFSLSSVSSYGIMRAMQLKKVIFGPQQPRVAIAPTARAKDALPTCAAAASRLSGRAEATNDGLAARAASDRLAAWLARYEPVEREIIEAHERRLANRARPNAEAARDFADLCEATEGLSVVWRRRWCAGRTATCSPCSVAKGDYRR